MKNADGGLQAAGTRARAASQRRDGAHEMGVCVCVTVVGVVLAGGRLVVYRCPSGAVYEVQKVRRLPSIMLTQFVQGR